MKVGLIDIDNIRKTKIRFPSLPLMKLSAYHKTRGDSVEWWFPLETYDIVYKCKVFAESPELEYTPIAAQIIEIGTGYGHNNALPQESEHAMPDYTLYSQFKASYSFYDKEEG